MIEWSFWLNNLIGKVSEPYLDWGEAELTLVSLSLYLILEKQKLAPSLDRMVILAKQFDRQSFRILFGLGVAESTFLFISLYLIL